MSRLLIVALVLLAVVTALTVGAFKLLGWWAVLVVPVVAIVFVKFVAGRLLKRLFLMPFKAKGAVLQGARSEVHAVAPTQRPAPSEDDEGGDEDDKRNYFLIEATITPTADTQAFALWEPGSLLLTPAGTDPENSDEEDDDTQVVLVEVLQDGAWQRDEGMKYPGAQRLRLTVAADPAASRLQFQYYFETFGEVTLPRVIVATATPVTS